MEKEASARAPRGSASASILRACVTLLALGIVSAYLAPAAPPAAPAADVATQVFRILRENELVLYFFPVYVAPAAPPGVRERERVKERERESERERERERESKASGRSWCVSTMRRYLSTAGAAADVSTQVFFTASLRSQNLKGRMNLSYYIFSN